MLARVNVNDDERRVGLPRASILRTTKAAHMHLPEKGRKEEEEKVIDDAPNQTIFSHPGGEDRERKREEEEYKAKQNFKISRLEMSKFITFAVQKKYTGITKSTCDFLIFFSN